MNIVQSGPYSWAIPERSSFIRSLIRSWLTWYAVNLAGCLLPLLPAPARALAALLASWEAATAVGGRKAGCCKNKRTSIFTQVLILPIPKLTSDGPNVHIAEAARAYVKAHMYAY